MCFLKHLFNWFGQGYRALRRFVSFCSFVYGVPKGQKKRAWIVMGNYDSLLELIDLYQPFTDRFGAVLSHQSFHNIRFNESMVHASNLMVIHLFAYWHRAIAWLWKWTFHTPSTHTSSAREVTTSRRWWRIRAATSTSLTPTATTKRRRATRSDLITLICQQMHIYTAFHYLQIIRFCLC